MQRLLTSVVDITFRSALSASGLPCFICSVVCGRGREDKERKYAELLHGDRCPGRGHPGDWGQVEPGGSGFRCWVAPGPRGNTLAPPGADGLAWWQLVCIPHALVGVDGVGPDLADFLAEAWKGAFD